MRQVEELTPGEGHYFHGFYNIQPWNEDQTLFLCHRAPFMDRMPSPEDSVEVGVVDSSGDFTPVGRSTAWNFQLGTLAHWLPGDRVIYNVSDGAEYRSLVVDPRSGSRREVERPIFSVGRDGRTALGHNFARTYRFRPGYGYNAHEPVDRFESAPDDDGIFRMDLETGEARLIVSLAELGSRFPHPDGGRARDLIVGRTLFNWDDTRFVTSFRFHDEATGTWPTAIVTGDLDGSDLRLMVPYAAVPKHWDWFDNDRLVVWSTFPDTGTSFHVVDDRSDGHLPFGLGHFSADGHCSIPPGGGLFLSDTFPDADRLQHIRVYDPVADRSELLGSFHSPDLGDMDIRCDLHPCWNRTATALTFDSIHEGRRSTYRIDL